MPRSAIAFGSAEQRSKPLDGARLVNLFPEQPPLGSRAPGLAIGVNTPIKAVLYGTPGLALWATVGMGPIRAQRLALGYLWALSGQQLYRIDSSGNTTLCTGDTIEPSGSAMMSDNGRQLALLANGKTYVVGTIYARAAFRITGGTLAAGTNTIASVVVNSVTITSGAVNWSDSNEATAAALVANINAHQAVYEASAVGATVVLDAVTGGVNPNGFAVVVTAAGNVTLKNNPTTMAGGTGAVTTVRLVDSANYPAEGASSIDFLDGYTIWTKADSRQWFLSGLNNTTSIDALDFASAESSPGNLVRVLVDHRETWLFKTDGIEVWANAGTSPFPFVRIPGAVLEKGCASGLSAAKLDNSVFWLGDDGIVYRAQGYQPVRISEHWLEEAIRGQTVSDAFALTYIQGGHAFYALTFPTLNRTFVYDCATTRWHERQSGTTQNPMAWRVRCITDAFGMVLAGIDTGRVCEIDMDTYTEAGDTIRRVAVTPPLYPAGKRARMSEVELEAELGVGISTGQGSDPQVMLRWSDDGGATFSNEHWTGIGATGIHRNRATWHRLGQFRQRQLEFSVSDPVKVAFYGFRVEVGP